MNDEIIESTEIEVEGVLWEIIIARFSLHESTPAEIRVRAISMSADSTTVTTYEKLDRKTIFNGVLPKPSALSPIEQLEETVELATENISSEDAAISVDFSE